MSRTYKDRPERVRYAREAKRLRDQDVLVVDEHFCHRDGVDCLIDTYEHVSGRPRTGNGRRIAARCERWGSFSRKWYNKLPLDARKNERGKERARVRRYEREAEQDFYAGGDGSVE